MTIYPASIQTRGDSVYMMADTAGGNALAVFGPDMELFEGERISLPEKVSGYTNTLSAAAAQKSGKEFADCKICPLTVENSKVIRSLFDYTNPKPHKGHDVTIGLGDRLGLASPGHIRLIRGLDVFPVLAQQSMRELNLTGRTYDDVLAAAVWAVFRENYTDGYGADGDHLKTHDEVKHALDCGCTMITLDCSEHIRNEYAAAQQSAVDVQYATLPGGLVSSFEEIYLKKTFPIGGGSEIMFEEADFRRIVLVYSAAIDHAVSIFDGLIKRTQTDFEVSIDETLSVTTPQAHFFVANELIRRGVDITSIAPRFIGEFQKGIDYIGEVTEFERDFAVHAKIAAHFGYKVSVHSGSDKFSIFPAIGRLTDGRYHIKTAGTNWLEALRVIAAKEPKLYREIHTFALENLPEARKYYTITDDISDIADIDSVTDADLPAYLNHDSARQVLHITYGLILQSKTPDGSPLFRSRIYSALHKHEADYLTALEQHIGKHLGLLGVREK